MASCVDQYFADLDECDAKYEVRKAACNGDPECIQQAVMERQACEQAAYLRYIQCIGQQGGSSAAGGGAPGSCGCSG